MTHAPILAEVALAHNLTVKLLTSKCRERRVVVARDEAIRRLRRELPHYTLQDIGKVFRMHHTAILHAIRRSSPPEDAAAAEWMEKH